MKPLVFAFDVYGTLADTAGIAAALSRYMDSPMAQTFAQKWREKQLEYTFRRALMRRYADFGICTRESLDFVCDAMHLNLDDAAKESVIAEYAQLPLFADAREALESLKKSGARMFAFSNGTEKAVRTILQNADALHFFEDVISVDAIKTFKPDPAVYAHFIARSGAEKTRCWLISGNAFDVLGAINCGWNAAWVQRNDSAAWDAWKIPPTKIIADLRELANLIKTA